MPDISGSDAIHTRPSILRAPVLAHRDAYAALKAMPVIVGAAIVVSLGQSLGEFYFRSEAPHENFLPQLMLVILWSLLFTPILIAIHRFILLGETTSSYRIESTRRYTSFFQWSFAINGGALLLTALGALFLNANLGLGLFWIFVLLVFVFVTLRLSLLFPAIAVDAPGASFRNAYRDTKGHVFTILMIVVLSALPMLIIVGTLSAILGLPEKTGALTTATVIETVLVSVVGAFYFAVFVAIVSRLYEWMGDRLKRVP